MDPAHVMDWGRLDLGHPEASVTTVDITDMQVFVHGLEEIKGSNLPIAVVVRSVSAWLCTTADSADPNPRLGDQGAERSQDGLWAHRRGKGTGRARWTETYS